MGKISVTVEEAVEVLNRLLKKDPGAMSMLVHARVLCNEELANDETAQVGRKSPGIYRIGLLGVLNGIFGIDEKGMGYIIAELDDDSLAVKHFYTQGQWKEEEKKSGK